jgi:hypothetical protein
MTLPLAALGEPGAHCFRQAFRMDAKTRFENTCGDKKCDGLRCSKFLAAAESAN